MLLQTNMNSINNYCDSTKRAETFYVHCDPLAQNEYARYENNIYTHPQTYKHISIQINRFTETCVLFKSDSAF